jgi:hypothetical protein
VRHWTPETDREADVLYRAFTYAEIRRYQDLAEQQMALAWQRRGEHGMDDAIADLQAMHDALARELGRRLTEGGDTGPRQAPENENTTGDRA